MVNVHKLWTPDIEKKLGPPPFVLTRITYSAGIPVDHGPFPFVWAGANVGQRVIMGTVHWGDLHLRGMRGK